MIWHNCFGLDIRQDPHSLQRQILYRPANRQVYTIISAFIVYRQAVFKLYYVLSLTAQSINNLLQGEIWDKKDLDIWNKLQSLKGNITNTKNDNDNGTFYSLAFVRPRYANDSNVIIGVTFALWWMKLWIKKRVVSQRDTKKSFLFYIFLMDLI